MARYRVTTAAIRSRHQIMSCVDHLSTPVYKCFPPYVRADAAPRRAVSALCITYVYLSRDSRDYL